MGCPIAGRQRRVKYILQHCIRIKSCDGLFDVCSKVFLSLSAVLSDAIHRHWPLGEDDEHKAVDFLAKIT